MNKTNITQKINSLKTTLAPYRIYLIIGACIIGLLLLWYGISTFTNWLHDVNYEHQQNVDKTAANNAEANANTHEAEANQAASNRKELEENENTIKQQQAEQQKRLDADRNKSKVTRDRLHDVLNQNVPNRTGTDGLDDDQLRSDSNAAAAAINARRN